jgi:DNA polymerase-3 subunit epsilon
VILDTETTGIGNNDVVIQIGIIDLRERVLLDTLLRPTKRKRISQEATSRHGISMRMLANVPTLREIIDTLVDISVRKRIIIYNAAFDTRLLSQTAYQDNVPLPGGRWVMNVSARCIIIRNLWVHGLITIKIIRGRTTIFRT